MASGNADIQTNASAMPPVRTKVNKLNGRVRYFEASYTVPAAAGPGIGETITWGALPVGARLIGHMSKLYFSAGAASSTINLGDKASAARHMAAISVAAAGAAVPEAQAASGAQFETTVGDNSGLDNCTLISTVAGAALGANQVITLKVAYVTD